MEQVGVLRRWSVVGVSNARRSGSREEGRRQGRWRGGWAVEDGIGSAWSRSTRITSIWPVFFAPVLGLGFVSVVAPMGSDGAARLGRAAVRLRRCEGGSSMGWSLVAVGVLLRRCSEAAATGYGGSVLGTDVRSGVVGISSRIGGVRLKWWWRLRSHLRSEGCDWSCAASPISSQIGAWFPVSVGAFFTALPMSFTFVFLLGVVEINQQIRRRGYGVQIWTAWWGLNHVLIRMVFPASDLDTSLAYVVASLRSDIANRLWMAMVRLRSSVFAFSFISLGLVWGVLCYLLAFLDTGGLCPGKCTIRAIVALVRRRVPCSVNWSQPPSGRTRSRATGNLQWYLCWKTVRHSKLWLSMSGIFPVCCQKCKANGVANDALFAKWDRLECMVFVDMPNISLGCSYNLGFRLYVPPLYSVILSMVTV